MTPRPDSEDPIRAAFEAHMDEAPGSEPGGPGRGRFVTTEQRKYLYVGFRAGYLAGSRAMRDPIEEKIIAAIRSGRTEVDKTQREFGYDSMEFASARAAWHETITPLGAFADDMRLLKLSVFESLSTEGGEGKSDGE